MISILFFARRPNGEWFACDISRARIVACRDGGQVNQFINDKFVGVYFSA